MSLVQEMTEWLEDALDRNQIVHENDRNKAREFVRQGKAAVRLEQRTAEGLCNAVIHHGPGHQSTTNCRVQGPHDVHEAVYGSQRQFAEWRGEEVFSGFFDEPPTLDDDD